MKKIKLIFYIVSAMILGAVTMWEIISTRQQLVLSNGKQPETEVDRVKDVMQIWDKRKKFSLDEIPKVTPTNERETIGRPTSAPLTPTPTISI